MRRVLALSVITISSGAFAQTTTNCTTYYWGSTQCVSQTPQQSQGVNWGLINNNTNPTQSTMDAYWKGVQMRQQQELARQQAAIAQQQAEAAASQAQAAQQEAQMIASQQRADELHRVQSLEAAKIVTAGDCAGAEKYALDVGNLVLAKQVKDYCAK